MFQDARALDRQVSAQNFTQSMERYAKVAETWYDGTVTSIDRRMDHCDQLIHRASFTLSRQGAQQGYLRVLEALKVDRQALAGLREDLLTGAGSREDVVGPPGWSSDRYASSPDLQTLSGADKRWVTLESAKFVAANTDAVGIPHELSVRAHNHAALNTSTFSPARSEAVCRAFVAKVGELSRHVPVRTAARAKPIEDFDAQAMFLC